MPLYRTITTASGDTKLEEIGSANYAIQYLFLSPHSASITTIFSWKFWVRSLWNGNARIVVNHYKQVLFWKINKMKRKRIYFDRIVEA
jgi:hypothetical protein